MANTEEIPNNIPQQLFDSQSEFVTKWKREGRLLPPFIFLTSYLILIIDRYITFITMETTSC